MNHNSTRSVGFNDSREYTFEYEHINTSYVEHSSVYQFFYVFEIGDGHAQPLLYASEPSEPIQTRVFVSNYESSASNRDKITLWVVVAICVLSALFLFGLIATLIVLTLIKYKPSKFHKAAQIVNGAGVGGLGVSEIGGSGQNHLKNVNAMSSGAFNLMRSKFERADDFLCKISILNSFIY